MATDAHVSGTNVTHKTKYPGAAVYEVDGPAWRELGRAQAPPSSSFYNVIAGPAVIASEKRSGSSPPLKGLTHWLPA